MAFTLPFFVLSHPWQLLLIRILQLSISIAVGIALLVACVKDWDISDVPINLAGKLSPEPDLLMLRSAPNNINSRFNHYFILSCFGQPLIDVVPFSDETSALSPELGC